MEMTKAALKLECRRLELYSTPEINDKLYLQYKGWRKVENMEEYTGLRCLWLEGNGLRKIEGLDHQPEMRTLYLHENCIEAIEGLEGMPLINTLNLSKNAIKTVGSGIAHLADLKTLGLAHNLLVSAEDLAGVAACPTLQALDLQQNRIEDPAIVEVFEQLPDIRVIYLMGNPVTKKIKHYRKTMISRLPSLTYLDERPVFPEDRLKAERWAEGFAEGGLKMAQEYERAEIKRQREAKRASDEASFKAFGLMMKRARAEHWEKRFNDAALTRFLAGSLCDDDETESKRPESAEAERAREAREWAVRAGVSTQFETSAAEDAACRPCSVTTATLSKGVDVGIRDLAGVGSDNVASESGDAPNCRDMMYRGVWLGLGLKFKRRPGEVPPKQKTLHEVAEEVRAKIPPCIGIACRGCVRCVGSTRRGGATPPPKAPPGQETWDSVMAQGVAAGPHAPPPLSDPGAMDKMRAMVETKAGSPQAAQAGGSEESKVSSGSASGAASSASTVAPPSVPTATIRKSVPEAVEAAASRGASDGAAGAKGSFKMAERSTRRVVAPAAPPLPPAPPAASAGGTDFGELD